MPTPFCLCKPFSCKAYPGKTFADYIKPGHTTGGAGRGGSWRPGGQGGPRPGWARQHGVGRRQIGAPRRHPLILPPRAPKTILLDVPSEARKNEIPNKANRGTRRAVDDRLVSETKAAGGLLLVPLVPLMLFFRKRHKFLLCTKAE